MSHRARWLALALAALLIAAAACASPTAEGPAPTATPLAAAVRAASAPSAAAEPTAPPTATALVAAPTAPPAPPTTPPSPTTPQTATPVPLPTATPRPPPTATATAAPRPLALPTAARPPGRDPVDLARRLRPGPLVVATPPAARPRRVGDVEVFWVIDQTTKAAYQVSARLVYVTPHLHVYVAEGEDVPLAQVRASADRFEQKTYPTLRRYFGSEWSPGIDNDPRLAVLNARIPGVGGYFSSHDEYPRSVYQFSNEREMIYVNLASATPGTAGYDSTLAHEFAHMIQHNAFAPPASAAGAPGTPTASGADAWISEGTAVLAEKAVDLNGGGLARLFLSEPDTQLTDWAESPAEAARHYGAAYLFFDYFSQHFGGYAAVGRLLADGVREPASFDAHLVRQGLAASFDAVFADWVVANYLGDRSTAQPRQSYREPAGRAKAEAIAAYPARRTATVQQYAADYHELQDLQGDVTIAFAGQGELRLVESDARSGGVQWWSSRGDLVDSRLTRRFDLTGLTRATLEFSTWYDIEEDYDYAYVEVSTDGGRTWRTLPGRGTTTRNPNGGNYGHGFTGRSGGGPTPRWSQERVDLTPFVGREVLLRFEYVTDDAYNASGYGLDDVAIPELGFRDDAEAEAGWQAEGFVRTTNRVPARYVVQVIALGRTTTVQALPLGAAGRGQLTYRGVGPGRDVERLVVAVAGLTRITNRPASYELAVSVSR